ncbi:PrmA4 [Desulfosarcina cetonica]|uniref:class I SAM-dependent methyltransferase n=1 Tax=Desulfosarcina cetonica TaxID=90730 RepID=UPI0006D1FE2A|nr:methyltransferase [Desulfosarcina cetonica]VTR65575.1 PrmA4 [Desulfosarcina cetonica]
MFDLDHFVRTYDPEAIPISINGTTLQLFKPATIDRFLDHDDITLHFPLWAKLWEASGVLASYLTSLPPEGNKTMLEIGSGLGLVGIAAARAGHRVTMTELNPHALNFARANALANGCAELPISRLDWNVPDLEGRFDYIVGSETIYRSEDIDGLEALFERYLNPGGTIIMAESVRRTGVEFWERMRHHYDIQVRRQRLCTDGEELHIVLFRMRHKTEH